MDWKCHKCGYNNRNLFLLYAIQYQFNHLLNDILTVEENAPIWKLKSFYNLRQILDQIDNEIEIIKKEVVKHD